MSRHSFDFVAGDNRISGFDSDTEQRDILKLSHGTAVILLFSEFGLPLLLRPHVDVLALLPPVYVSYLVFQLFSHKRLYDDKNGIKPETIKYAPRTGPSAKEKTRKFFGLSPVKEAKEDAVSAEAGSEAHLAQSHPGDDTRRAVDEEQPDVTGPEEEEDEEIPELSLQMTIALLVVVTVLVAVTAEWLVDSIDGLAEGGVISKEFIGLILLPIVGNAAEHVTAVTVSVKDKLTLSLGVAVGSSIVSSFPPPQLCR